MSTYYPLKTGNSWTYGNNDGSTFVNKVEREENGVFFMSNSTVATLSQVKKEGDVFYTDSYEAGNMQPFLKENVAVGDKWEIKYLANTINSILSIEIKSVGGTKEVEGKSYSDVMEMEGVMSFNVNGNIINAGTKYNWFYAKDIGLIQTTSTLGVNMPLKEYSI